VLRKPNVARYHENHGAVVTLQGAQFGDPISSAAPPDLPQDHFRVSRDTMCIILGQGNSYWSIYFFKETPDHTFGPADPPSRAENDTRSCRLVEPSYKRVVDRM